MVGYKGIIALKNLPEPNFGQRGTTCSDEVHFQLPVVSQNLQGATREFGVIDRDPIGRYFNYHVIVVIDIVFQRFMQFSYQGPTLACEVGGCWRSPSGTLYPYWDIFAADNPQGQKTSTAASFWHWCSVHSYRRDTAGHRLSDGMGIP